MVAQERLTSIYLIEIDNHWSRACVDGLAEHQIVVERQDPAVELIELDKTRGNCFLIPVSRCGSNRFDLVERVAKFGGISLVLAGGEAGDVQIRCMTFPRTIFCGNKSLNFEELAQRIRDVRQVLSEL